MSQKKEILKYVTQILDAASGSTRDDEVGMELIGMLMRNKDLFPPSLPRAEKLQDYFTKYDNLCREILTVRRGEKNLLSPVKSVVLKNGLGFIDIKEDVGILSNEEGDKTVRVLMMKHPDDKEQEEMSLTVYMRQDGTAFVVRTEEYIVDVELCHTDREFKEAMDIAQEEHNKHCPHHLMEGKVN